MKRNVPTLILGLSIALLLLLYMVTYQVSFNETAVVTTFGKAGEGAVKNADGKGAGLYWKWPYPIQDVRRFDSRIRTLEDRPEELSTRDKQNVIVHTYVAWRIAQPLAFSRSLRNAAKAEKQLRSRLREAKAVISQYDFDQLANADPKRLKLQEIETKILEKLQREVDAQHYGVAIEAVGIKQLVLPEAVTEKVFERMRSTRERLAQGARSSGQAIAARITSDAERARQTIMAFAERRAQAIRAEGDAAAAQYYPAFQKDEEFAIFLRQLDALEAALKNHTTFLLDTNTAPFNLLKEKAAGKQEQRKSPAASAGPAEKNPGGR